MHTCCRLHGHLLPQVRVIRGYVDNETRQRGYVYDGIYNVLEAVREVRRCPPRVPSAASCNHACTHPAIMHACTHATRGLRPHAVPQRASACSFVLRPRFQKSIAAAVRRLSTACICVRLVCVMRPWLALQPSQHGPLVCKFKLRAVPAEGLASTAVVHRVFKAAVSANSGLKASGEGVGVEAASGACSECPQSAACMGCTSRIPYERAGKRDG